MSIFFFIALEVLHKSWHTDQQNANFSFVINPAQGLLVLNYAPYLLYNILMSIRKYLWTIIIILGFLFEINMVHAIPNPWTECNDDIYCAANIAGFNFPLRINNYSVRAMKGMMELKFPINKKRTVTVRKSTLSDGKFDKNGIADISGDYNNYPVNKTIWIERAVPFNIRGREKINFML